jgi:hypothetical protein
MHPGLWLAFGRLGEHDFWRNAECCRVEHVHFADEPRDGAGEGSFTVLQRYVAQGTAICEETARVSVARRASGVVLALDAELRAIQDIDFGDQQEMGFGVRLATPITAVRGGRLADSERRRGEKEIWGREAAWCAGSGELDGRTAGIALLAHPGNPHRSRVHARDYGLIVMNPFARRDFGAGDENRVPLAQGETLHLRFAAFVFAGEREAAETAIEDAFRAHAAAPGRGDTR